MEYDAVIVGAGPAGSSAAWFLRNSGLKTAVIERLSDAKFGEYHSICGGGISRRGLSPLSPKEDEILNRVDRLRLRWPDGRSTDIRIDGYVIDRPALTRRLLAESNAERIHGSVKGVRPSGEYNDIILSDGRTVRGRYVIGADGAFSAVRRSVFGTRPEAMFPIEECIADFPSEDVFDFAVGRRFKGVYGWRFPCGRKSTMGSAADVEPPHIEGRKMHRFIPCGPVPDVVKDNVLLIGDAAGFPNPLTFGGLRVAFESARMAAAAAEKNDPSSYASWRKKSKILDPRFAGLHELMAGMTDEGFNDFSRAMTHRNLLVNGFCSVIRRPGLTKAYLGCLMAILYGW